MVTLTDFDGRSWSVRADYRRAGHKLPTPAGSAPHPSVEMSSVEMDVTVRYSETLGWLPSPGRAQQVNVAGLGVDEQTGDVVIPDGVPTPTRYRVVGVEPIPAPQALRADEPAPSPAPFALNLPPDVLEFVGAATTGVPAGFPQFSALYSQLTELPFSADTSADAPGEHGLFAISALLRDKRGTSEQYASAFALMCRSLGWDARVVLGFRPSFEGTELKVRGEDVHAWVEVRFARLSWITVDPTPARNVNRQLRDDGALAPTGRADDPVTDAINAERQAPLEPDSAGAQWESPTGADRVSPSAIALTIGLAAMLVLTLLVFAVPFCKAVRRARRRRRGTPRTRALAAWRETTDRLVETGLPIHRSTTTAEVLAAMPGAPQELATLGALADRAAFAPEELSSDVADAAWHMSDQLRRAVPGLPGPVHRLRAAFDPRPLFLPPVAMAHECEIEQFIGPAGDAFRRARQGLAMVLPRPPAGLSRLLNCSKRPELDKRAVCGERCNPLVELGNASAVRGLDDGVQCSALGLRDQVAELCGAHPDLGAEVVGEDDALLGRTGIVDVQLRAPAVAHTTEDGGRLGGGEVEHGTPPVSLPDHLKVLA